MISSNFIFHCRSIAQTAHRILFDWTRPLPRIQFFHDLGPQVAQLRFSRGWLDPRGPRVVQHVLDRQDLRVRQRHALFRRGQSVHQIIVMGAGQPIAVPPTIVRQALFRGVRTHRGNKMRRMRRHRKQLRI